MHLVVGLARIGVAPFTGAWIEIGKYFGDHAIRLGSLPSRERGLKCDAWERSGLTQAVAPFTGAWIEMLSSAGMRLGVGSLPSRERGLKSQPRREPAHLEVAPFTGAWIEIS